MTTTRERCSEIPPFCRLSTAFVRGIGLILVSASMSHVGGVDVTSPDRAVRFSLDVAVDRFEYRIMFRDRPVIESSAIGITLDGTDLTREAQVGEPKFFEIDETYPWRGGKAQASNRCRGATIPITKGGVTFALEVRTFNDGAAFRHVIPAGVGERVPDESTTFVVPAGSTVWYHDLRGHYEAVHQRADADAVPAGQWVAPPMTFKLPDGAGFASITESALVNYSGMALQAGGSRRFALALGHKHPVSYPFELRYRNDIERVSRPAAIAGTITSPWRVIIIGADLNAMVNTEIVHNLCPPPDPKLFPGGLNTAWIKPGRAVWRYLDGGSNSIETVKEFSRLAGELGFEYQVVEGFWSRWSDDQIKDVVEDSRQRGVGLWFWRHSRDLRTADSREAFFKRLRDFGVVGAKIDFFDHEHKEVVDLYPALLEVAARHRIMVNFHGANKPAGEARTWPNELIREGVRGMESSRLKERARHDTTLPFTRFLAGHGDYTPVHFGARRGDTTWAHQIATAAIFDEPLLTYGAHPGTLLNHPAVALIKSIPSVWDGTIVLPMSEIGELAAFARRRGDVWFLAIANGPSARNIDVPLRFLGEGAYRSMAVRDRIDDPAAVEIDESATVNRDSALEIELSAGGGFIGRFSPN